MKASAHLPRSLVFTFSTLDCELFVDVPMEYTINQTYRSTKIGKWIVVQAARLYFRMQMGLLAVVGREGSRV